MFLIFNRHSHGIDIASYGFETEHTDYFFVLKSPKPNFSYV